MYYRSDPLCVAYFGCLYPQPMRCVEVRVLGHVGMTLPRMAGFAAQTMEMDSPDAAYRGRLKTPRECTAITAQHALRPFPTHAGHTGVTQEAMAATKRLPAERYVDLPLSTGRRRYNLLSPRSVRSTRSRGVRRRQDWRQDGRGAEVESVAVVR